MTHCLSAHVRACQDGDWIVFLDLRQNAYAAIDASHVQLGAHGAIDASEVILERLRERGWLNEPDAAASQGAMRVGRRAAVAVLGACIWARRVVDSGQLERAAHFLQTIKHRRVRRARDFSADVDCYVRLRPWFPGDHACLFDSLALSRFLLERGHLADWIIGVKARPFAAHSWVEADGEILNDDAEACAPFVEILRV